MLEEINAKVSSLATAWEEFKSVNDQRLSEIEKKGSADPLLNERLDKISKAIDLYKGRLDTIETTVSRSPNKSEGKDAEGAEVIEYRKAFSLYAKKGLETDLRDIEKKALSVQSDPDGGYLVTPQMSQTIVKKVFETSAIRQVASVETISSDALDMISDVDEAASGWATETGARVETNSPAIGKKSIIVHELFAQPKATQKLLDDSAINIEAWLAEKIGDAFSRKENTAFVSGDGVGKPRGFLTYASGAAWGQIEQVTSGSPGVVTADGLIRLFYGLKSEYSANGTFLMNRSLFQAVRLLKDTTNQYIWQPGLTAGAPDTLLGRPAIQASDMPDAAANSLSVAFADFRRAYQIVDRVGIRTLRDPYTEKPFVKFYTTKRVGGDVANFEAIKLLRLA